MQTHSLHLDRKPETVALSLWKQLSSSSFLHLVQVFMLYFLVKYCDTQIAHVVSPNDFGVKMLYGFGFYC